MRFSGFRIDKKKMRNPFYLIYITIKIKTMCFFSNLQKLHFLVFFPFLLKIIITENYLQLFFGFVCMISDTSADK